MRDACLPTSQDMNSLKMLVLLLFQCSTVWCLSDLSIEGDFAVDLPPGRYYVSEYCEFNGKCFLCKEVEGGGKTTSMFEEQKRDRVLTGMWVFSQNLLGHHGHNEFE